MKKKIEDLKAGEYVFAQIDRGWQKAKVNSNENGNLIVSSGGSKYQVDSSSVEIPFDNSQKFAKADVKQQLASSNGINEKDVNEKLVTSLAYGNEAIISGQTFKENDQGVKVGKESVKLVQLNYNYKQGSTLDVEWKQEGKLTKDTVKPSYNHEFTKAEIDKMLKEPGKPIKFEGVSNDGEVFQKLAYYEPKINKIRTKNPLKENSKFYGTTLTKEQADALNKGNEVMLESKNGKKYAVTFDFKNSKYIAKSMDQAKANTTEVKAEEVKKKGNGVTM